MAAKEWVCPNGCGMEFKSERDDPICPDCSDQEKGIKVYMVEK
ncbi:hypothetical protein [Thermoflavimicrobium daqui]|nr:hypothetical protein [Thermoflavimicrobium daqui]